MTGRAAVPGYLRTREVAALLHVTPQTVTSSAREGKLPYIRTASGRYLFPKDEIGALAAKLAAPEDPPQGRQP